MIACIGSLKDDTCTPKACQAQCMNIYIYIQMHIYMNICIYMCIYIYISI